jgi:deoxyribose-phosphate aldolase
MREATEGKVIKLIIETGLLTDEEKRMISKLAIEAGFDYIKTSTGISVSGATVEDVKLMKEIAGDKFVKASGGVRTYEDAVAMIEAGASRIGTSNGVDILNGKEGTNDY